jgi:hypothetical protein
MMLQWMARLVLMLVCYAYGLGACCSAAAAAVDGGCAYPQPAFVTSVSQPQPTLEANM